MPKNSSSEVNYCEKCGESVNREALYCQRCGEMISRNEAFHRPADHGVEFMSNYLITLISIIQATVFGFLLLVAKDKFSSILAGTYNPLWTPLIVGMFLMITLLWINYIHYASSLRLKPRSSTALISFCFGATQAFAIFSISLQQLAVFYFAMAANALLAILQTFSTFREARLHQEYEENRAYIENNPLSILKWWYATRGLIFIFFGIAALFNLYSLLLAIVFLALCVMSFIFVGRGAKQIASTS